MTADTSSLPAHFDPEAIEPALVERWVGTGVGRADVTSPRPKFSMVMPPPNVTGQLHIGHALDMTLQDVVARHKRQRGFDVLWLPGTDHASIATHFVVERELAEGSLRRLEVDVALSPLHFVASTLSAPTVGAAQHVASLAARLAADAPHTHKRS